MLGYVMLGSNDPAAAEAFYSQVLVPLGGSKNAAFSSETSAWFSFGEMSSGLIAIGRPHDGQPATASNGGMIALRSPDRDAVHAAHAKALELGGADEGAPGPRGDSGFYGAYFRDLDGNKLCVFHFGRPGA